MSGRKLCKRKVFGNCTSNEVMVTDIEDLGNAVCIGLTTPEHEKDTSIYADVETAAAMKSRFWTGQSDTFIKKTSEHQELLEFRKDISSGLRYLAKICACENSQGFTFVTVMVQIYNKVNLSLVDLWYTFSYETSKYDSILTCVKDFKVNKFKSKEYEVRRDAWLEAKKGEYCALFKPSQLSFTDS